MPLRSHLFAATLVIGSLFAFSACGNSSSTSAPPAANPAVAPLTAAKTSLDTAKLALAAATTKDHGGYVEKARTQVNQAMSNLAAASTYIAEHPDVGNQPAVLSAAASAATFNDAGLTHEGQPSMYRALDNIMAAYTQLQTSPGGDLGGYRDRTLEDLHQAAADTIAGIRVVEHTTSAGTLAAPARAGRRGR